MVLVEHQLLFAISYHCNKTLKQNNIVMDAPSNQRPVGDYTRNDVLFGRGGGINVHPGKLLLYCFIIWIHVYSNSILRSLRFSYVLVLIS